MYLRRFWQRWRRQRIAGLMDWLQSLLPKRTRWQKSCSQKQTWCQLYKKNALCCTNVLIKLPRWLSWVYSGRYYWLLGCIVEVRPDHYKLEKSCEESDVNLGLACSIEWYGPKGRDNNRTSWLHHKRQLHKVWKAANQRSMIAFTK